jgi:ABC-2 type transport system ATP-binding protein
MAPTACIDCVDLTKYYGRHRGVEGLDLQIRYGEVFGFLGPNGAGKTTTIRLLLDLIRPTSGSATVLGHDSKAGAIEIHKKIGYLPGELSLYGSLTSMQLFRYFDALRGGGGLAHAQELCDRLGLDASRPIEDLSKGNKQKVGLIQALMGKPALLILDEPTSGLDPLVQHTFQELLQEITSEGRTVFLSSHVLSELEHIAHRVGIIREGRLVAVEEVEALKQRAVRHLRVHFGDGTPDVHWLGISGVTEAAVDDVGARFVVEGSMDALLKVLAAHNVTDLISEEPALEDVFFSYYAEPDGTDG